MDIKGIAKLAGVAPSTVSKVINGKAHSISDATKQKILQLVRDYHYVPYGKSSAAGPSPWLVGIVFRNRSSMDKLLAGMLSYIQEQGCTALVHNSHDNPEQEHKNIEALIAAGVSSLIWEPISPCQEQVISRIVEAALPCVTIGLATPCEEFLNFCLPYYEMASFLTQELIETGHTKIACFAKPGKRTQAVIDGYGTAMQQNAHKALPIFADITSALENAIAQDQVSAIVCSHYNAACDLVTRLQTLHLHVPSNVCVVAIKNEHERTDMISACLVPNSEFARMVCKELFAEKTTQHTTNFSTAESTNTTPHARHTPHFSHSYDFALTSRATIVPPTLQTKKRVVVVGSINYDTQLSVDTLPSFGVTQSAHSLQHAPGGKATNQAIGVAKLGYQAHIIGAVGDDAAASSIYQELSRWNIDTSGISRVSEAPTGQAYISVDRAGNSAITLIPGANATLDAAQILLHADLFKQADACLVQTEIPASAVEKTCELAHAQHIPVLLKPADCTSLDPHVLSLVDFLVPNEDELAAICPQEATLEARCEALCAHGARTIIVTRAEKGCYVYGAGAALGSAGDVGSATNTASSADADADDPSSAAVPSSSTASTTPSTVRGCTIRGFHVEAIDDTGAGDAFISAFTYALLEGHTCLQAAHIANTAAAYSTTRPGVSSAFIDKSMMETIVETQIADKRYL